MSETPIALTIAGSDSGGGAGIQADLKTFSALGVYGASVITALTAQNTREVRAIFDVAPDFIAAQMDCVFDDLAVGATKIGMLSQPAVIETVAAVLKARKIAPVVLDPVMVAKSGDNLLQPDAVESLRRILLPLASVITPNLPEAAALIARPVPHDEEGMRETAERLLDLGARSVLLKGGHLQGEESFDLFFDGSEAVVLPAKRVATKNTHGTGCSLSSAIAAYLARGYALDDAIENAKRYIYAAIAEADSLTIGGGHGPVHHFHALWSHLED
jgi:hydroxymethylpyrimidine/phosphomethylpyrimidine kinase